MSNLRVVVDQILAPEPGEVGRYTAELTRELIAAAPDGVAVEGIVSASPAADYERLLEELPGLGGLQKSAFDRRALQGVLRRGLERGELPAGVDLDELVDRLAGPVFHRRFISGLPLEPGFSERVVDGVLRPPSGESADRRHDG